MARPPTGLQAESPAPSASELRACAPSQWQCRGRPVERGPMRGEPAPTVTRRPLPPARAQGTSTSTPGCASRVCQCPACQPTSQTAILVGPNRRASHGGHGATERPNLVMYNRRQLCAQWRTGRHGITADTARPSTEGQCGSSSGSVLGQREHYTLHTHLHHFCSGSDLHTSRGRVAACKLNRQRCGVPPGAPE